MKRFAILALVLSLAAPAWAATYTLNTTTAEEAVTTRARTDDNAKACGSVGLLAGCTQAQADAARPGAVTIYANNGTYLLAVLRAEITAKWEQAKAADRDAFANALAVATTEQKAALCAAVGLPAGCLP